MHICKYVFVYLYKYICIYVNIHVYLFYIYSFLYIYISIYIDLSIIISNIYLCMIIGNKGTGASSDRSLRSEISSPTPHSMRHLGKKKHIHTYGSICVCIFRFFLCIYIHIHRKLFCFINTCICMYKIYISINGIYVTVRPPPFYDTSGWGLSQEI
jgi:hypothetical protein